MAYEEEIAAYRASRERIQALAQDLDDAQLATVVPCCPKWTAKDLLGHLTGLLEDRVAGRLPTGGSMEDWTDAQVARHRGQSRDEVLAAWDALVLEPSDAPPSTLALAFDAVTHEHDLFFALGVRGDTESDSVRVGARRATERVASLLVEPDAPSLVLSTEDGERTMGGSGPTVRLDATRFELARLVCGRVSEREARALRWDGDPTPILTALFADGFFRLQPADALVV